MTNRTPWTREQILAHGQDPDCVFCAITRGESPAKILGHGPHTMTIEPLNPVVDGHALVIPRQHVADFTEDPLVSRYAMQEAATYAATVGGPCNLITSKGREATQSVFHLHLHIVPRAKDDGLALPWYSGKGGH